LKEKENKNKLNEERMVYDIKEMVYAIKIYVLGVTYLL